MKNTAKYYFILLVAIISLPHCGQIATSNISGIIPDAERPSMMGVSTNTNHNTNIVNSNIETYSSVPGNAAQVAKYICRKKGERLQEYLKWNKDEKKHLIMAHRTSLPSYLGLPENSLSALQYIYKHYPCVMPEVDVRMSKDSVLMLLHDRTLNRTTTGTGNINQMLYKDIRKLSFKNESNEILPNQKVPTLQEILSQVKGNRIIFLDMKPGTSSALLMKQVVKSNTLDNVIVICYTMDEAIKLNKEYPKLMMALGFDEERIPLIEKSGIPFENLVALIPGERQEPQFYDKIHAMEIMSSVNANGGLDTLRKPEVFKAYKDVWNNVGDIICTDSLLNATKALNH